MQRKKRRRFSAGPWLHPKYLLRRCWGTVVPLGYFAACRCRRGRPSLWEFRSFVRSSRTGNNMIIIARAAGTVKIRQRAIKKLLLISAGTNQEHGSKYVKSIITGCRSVHTYKNTRFGIQNRTGIRRNNIKKSTNHELSAATRRSEMTLDYSFLSDSRNFFV